jgi:hypothetical protein
VESTEASSVTGNDRSDAPQGEAKPFIAFYGTARPLVRLAPAPRWRAWINEMEERWANRCLPLVMSNEAGWVLLNPVAFEAAWSGDNRTSGVTIEFAAEDFPHPLPVESHFGYGIITWSVPFIFRTPPGYNLLARGPANWPKDGICALEGLVETDWSVASFTMNWKLTRANHPVRFEAGDPYCMVVPQRRGELESFRPELRKLKSDPALHAATTQWAKSRHELNVRKFLAEYSLDFADDKGAWERHYYRGMTRDGEKAPEHQTQLRLPDFTEPESQQ